MNETKTIKKDLETYKILKSKAVSAFDEANYELALDYAYLAATLAWDFYFSIRFGIWYDDELEHLLSEIGKRIIGEVKYNFGKKVDGGKGKHKKVVYIVSHLYDSGGHSRALKQWTNLLSDFFDEQHVYITNVTNRPTYSPYIIHSLESNGIVVRQLSWYDSYVDRIEKLNEWMEADPPDIVVLFIHPNDVVAVSSLSSCANKPYTIFFNHADHVFWLGRNIADSVVEWRTEGARFSKRFRKISNIVVIPLTTDVKPQKISKTTYGIPEGSTVSVSIGSFYKVVGNAGTDYFETVRKLLKMFPNHYHLFVTNPPPQNILEKYLPSDQGARKRLIVTGPFSNLGPIYGVADFLIETFPLVGGTVRVEAMACKLPIVAFRNEKVTLFSKTDALPPNYPFIASTTEGIIEYSSKFIQNPELRSKVGNYLYEYYKQNFSHEKIRELLTDLVTKKNRNYTSYPNLNVEQFGYNIEYMRPILKEKKEFLMDRNLLLQATLKRSKFSLRQRLRFYVNSLKSNEFKSKKEIIGSIILTIFGWRGASLYSSLRNKGRIIKKWSIPKLL